MNKKDLGLDSVSEKMEVDDSAEFRLSAKGAIKETGRHSIFKVNKDAGSTTGRIEKEKLLREQLDNVDFYIEQGYFEVALSTLEKLEDVYPSHPLISERLEKMAQLERGEGPLSAKLQPIQTTTFEGEVVDYLPTIEDSIPPTLTEEFEVKMLFNPIDVFELTDTEDEASEAQQNEINEMTELPDELVEIHKASQNSQQIENLPKRKKVITEGSFKAMFEDLQDEAEVVESDFQEHFNVGQAYLDIGLYDDAIEEFQVAFKKIQDNPSHPGRFDCCLILGRTFLIQGMYKPALIWLRRALDTQTRTEQEYNEARYEIALVQEELEQNEAALQLYLEIQKVDPSYKDISEKIAKLSA
ncbi:MAG: tetratricopeptide repeat protein [Blastocatellia bacterium]|nr:tetratricopeptide repeat protein [Blastocatellia bacterium]